MSGLFLGLGRFGRVRDLVSGYFRERGWEAPLAFWDFVTFEAHYGGGTLGRTRLVFLGSAFLFLLATGAILFARVQGRLWGRAPARPAPAHPGTFAARRRVYLLLGAAAVGFGVLVVTVLSQGLRISALYAPTMHALSRAAVHAAGSHRELEELLAGDPEATIDRVWNGLERAGAYLEAARQGRTLEGVAYLPAPSGEARRRLEGAAAALGALRDLTVERFVVGEAAGSSLDHRYDRVFEGFQAAVQGVEQAVFDGLRDAQERLVSTHLALGGACLVLVLWLGIEARRYDEQRALYLREVERSRDRLEAEREFLDQVVQQSADPLLLFDPEGTVQEANEAACRWLGYGREDLVGKGWDDLDATHPFSAMKREWERLEPGAPSSLRHRVRNREGKLLDSVSNQGVIEVGEERWVVCLLRPAGRA
ncbi:MAG: PAS domain S-box protein [Candidatus Dadabacteria bacterium]|nr:MAG: PAS domain S-box protein [Candidatus Dadabacteria bacterium]